MKQFLNIILFIALSFTGIGQTAYQLTPTGLPYASVSAAKKAIPKKSQVAGQTAFIKIAGYIQPVKYAFDNKGNFEPVAGQDVAVVQAQLDDVRKRELWVEDFRDPGEEDIKVWEDATAEANRQSKIAGTPIQVKAARNPTRDDGRYIFTRTLIFPLYYNVQVDAPEATIINGIKGFDFIEPDGRNKPEIDLSYPTETYLGPLRGSAFYIVRSGNEVINVGKFERFRFCVSWFTDSNSPKLTFSVDNCNVGGICYQGSQNYSFIDCSGICSGAWFIGTATAFPEDSPYKNSDNSYCDGFQWKSIGHPKQATAVLNPVFDVWVRDCFLRPTTVSYVYPNKASTYYEGDIENDYCLPSGRILYLPFRNGRECFGLHIDGIDARGGLERGIALVNTGVNYMAWSGDLALENIKTNAGGYDKGYLVIGAAGSVKIDIPYDQASAGVYNNFQNIVNYTGRGYSSGNWGQWDHVNFTAGFVTGITWLDRRINEHPYYMSGVLQNATDGTIEFRCVDKNFNTYLPVMKGAALAVAGFEFQEAFMNECEFDKLAIGEKQFRIIRESKKDGTINDNMAINGRWAVFTWKYENGDPRAYEAMYKAGLLK